MSKAYNKREAGLGELGNLRRLVYFAAVVETGSFTAAAERLGITKAVVSQQVARLEKEFRTSLLVRTTRKVQPTEAGQAFYQCCAAILREAEDAFGELAEAVAEPAGGIHAVFPSARFRPAKVRTFVEVLSGEEKRRYSTQAPRL